MDNLKWLEKRKEEDDNKYASCCNVPGTFTKEYRKIKALEIIAEELINVKSELNNLSTVIFTSRNN